MISAVSRVLAALFVLVWLPSVTVASNFPEWAFPACPKPTHPEAKAPCAYCHLSDGNGRPENAKIAGLPASYILAQIKAFRTKERQSAQPDWVPAHMMVESTADLPEEELLAAADWFSHQPVTSFLRVVERDRVPRHELRCFVELSSAGRPVLLGQRILEIPDDYNSFKRGDLTTSYVVYVPTGSIARGRHLANTGGSGRTMPCATCHGPALQGGENLPAPPLAGRFPNYLFRQLFGFQSGARTGDASQSMRPVVEKLTQADMIDLAAYAASLKP